MKTVTLKATNEAIESVKKLAIERGRNDATFNAKVASLNATLKTRATYESTDESSVNFAVYQGFTRKCNAMLDSLQARVNGTKKVSHAQLAQAIIAEARDKQTAERLAKREALRLAHHNALTQIATNKESTAKK